VGSIELHGLIGIFQRNVIGNLTVGILLVEVGNPIVFVVVFDNCQEPGGQLIGKDVADNGALLAVVGAIGGFQTAKAEDQEEEEDGSFHKNSRFLRIYRLWPINAGWG
jgi:hypothetical protein